jgi:4-hydroxybenzoate polyprenyltransferase
MEIERESWGPPALEAVESFDVCTGQRARASPSRRHSRDEDPGGPRVSSSMSASSTLPVDDPASTPLAVAAFRLLRPKQWTKNGLVGAALLFSGYFFDASRIGKAIAAIVAFCLLSSAGYVLNDYVDREADRRHPKKRLRPIASGAFPEALVIPWIALLLAGGAGLALLVSPKLLALGALYLVTTVGYSMHLKHVVLLDVMTLAACYVWRAIAGAVAIDVRVSPWFFLCTAFFALFLGFAKRKAELAQVGADGGTRRNLREYGRPMLDQIQGVVTSCTLVTYALYTLLGTTTWMMLTMPFVLYAVFRYTYLVEQKGEGGAPDETFLKDVPTLVTVGLYIVTTVAVLSADKLGWLPSVM